MATIYKTGSWAKHGRVMPGCRTKPKKIDQILLDGSVVCVGSDQKFSSTEIVALLSDCFADSQLVDHRVFLPALNNNGKGVYFYTRNINHIGGDWSSEKK